MSEIETQLSQYLLHDNEAQQIINIEAQRNQINQNSSLTMHQSQMCMFYQLGLIFVNFMIIVIIVLAYIQPTYEQGEEKNVIWGTMVVSGVIGLWWAITGYRKQYLTPFWAVFWGHYAAGLLFGVYALVSKSITTLLWSLLVSAIIFVAAQLWFLRSIYYLFMSVAINGLCIGLLADVILRKQDSTPIQLSYPLCIILFIFTLIGTWILGKYMKNNRGYMDQAQKYFCFCMVYLCVLAYCVCAIGLIGIISYVTLPWPVLTIPNFVIFLLICRYFHKILPHAHKKYEIFFNKIFFKICKTSPSNSSSEKQQKLFQVSLCLLCSEQDYVQCVRESVIGRPLSQCVCCLSQQSTFCYYSCKHACLGIQCAANWLQKNVRKCPICRMESNFVVRVQRVDHVQFNVIGKYKFKNNQL